MLVATLYFLRIHVPDTSVLPDSFLGGTGPTPERRRATGLQFFLGASKMPASVALAGALITTPPAVRDSLKFDGMGRLPKSRWKAGRLRTTAPYSNPSTYFTYGSHAEAIGDVFFAVGNRRVGGRYPAL
ncbi:hypothetical protein R1sor_020119 [Riccia sorocarpa]|uniref:Uncharacterized protein n=1 Tax=Riccia sorocarpa TaxID=122646 RepID=A0ABD3IH72_9MARC